MKKLLNAVKYYMFLKPVYRLACWLFGFNKEETGYVIRGLKDECFR